MKDASGLVLLKFTITVAMVSWYSSSEVLPLSSPQGGAQWFAGWMKLI